MHWAITGADAIFALRCHEASGTWEAICNEAHTQARPPDQEDPADDPDYLQN